MKSQVANILNNSVPEFDQANIDLYLWVLLAQTREAADNIRKKELRQYSLSPRQSGVLLAINAIGNEATTAQISRWLGRKPHTVSGILNRMEKTGLVSRATDLGKKNLVRISMTDKGRQSFQHSLRRESYQKTLSVLSLEEKQQLLTLLRKVREGEIKGLGSRYKLYLPSFK